MKPLFKLLRSFIIFLLVYLFIIIFLLNFRAVPRKTPMEKLIFWKGTKNTAHSYLHYPISVATNDKSQLLELYPILYAVTMIS